MKSSLTALLLSFSIGLLTTAYAAEPPAEMLELMDGSTLYLHPDGTGRMVDAHGKPMPMADGEQMKTKDGRTLMMKTRRSGSSMAHPEKEAGL